MKRKFLLLFILVLAGCTSLPSVTENLNWQYVGNDDSHKVAVEVRLVTQQNVGNGVTGHIWEARLVNSSKQAWCTRVIWFLVDIDNQTRTANRRLVLANKGTTQIGYLTEHLWRLQNGYLPLQGYGHVAAVGLLPPIMSHTGTLSCEFWTK